MKKNVKNIVSLRFYECGMEEFDFGECFINSKGKKEKLPVNVVLLEHRRFGNMLINTGCADTIKKNLANYAAYRIKHKLEFDSESSIIYRLEKEDTDPLMIKKVLLTHCSPECCGALPLLPRYELISSAQVMCMIKLGKKEDGVFRSTMPSSDIPVRAAGIFSGETVLKKYFKWVYDILGDGSVLGVDLRGHVGEMMGFYIPEMKLFYAADAAVDERVIENDLVPSESMLDRQVYPDEYLANLILLKKISREEKDIKLVFLHSRSVYENGE